MPYKVYKKFSAASHLCECAWADKGDGTPHIFHLQELDAGEITQKDFVEILSGTHCYSNFEIISWLRKYKMKEIDIHAE